MQQQTQHHQKKGLTLTIVTNIELSVSVCLSLSLFLSLSLSLSVCLPVCLPVSLSVSVSLSVCLSLPLSLPPSLFFFFFCLLDPSLLATSLPFHPPRSFSYSHLSLLHPHHPPPSRSVRSLLFHSHRSMMQSLSYYRPVRHPPPPTSTHPQPPHGPLPTHPPTFFFFVFFFNRVLSHDPFSSYFPVSARVLSTSTIIVVFSRCCPTSDCFLSITLVHRCQTQFSLFALCCLCWTA